MADTKSMVDEILKRVLMRIDSADLSKTSGATSNASCASAPVSSPAVSQLQTSMITEHVGSTITGDTIGLVIANVDSQVLEAMKLTKSYRSIGILGSRTGAGPQIMAADEAVKVVKSNDRVYVQAAAATPTVLTKALANRATELRNVEPTFLNTRIFSLCPYGLSSQNNTFCPTVQLFDEPEPPRKLTYLCVD